MRTLAERLRGALRGAPPYPLTVLTLLYFFDQFDTAAFGTLAPDIQRSFNLSDQAFGGLLVANASLLLVLSIPVGYLADRVKRTPLVVLSGLLAGAFSLATGLAGSVVLLTIARFGNGLGLLANTGIHNSLLSDYYEPEARPTVFGLHASAVPFGAIVGPLLAGLLGSTIGWRAVFFVLFVPIIITTVAVSRLREPVRGATDDPESADEASLEGVPFKEGVRTLWAVPTLKRQFIASLFIGAGLLPLAAYLPLYLERVYGLGPFPRGVIGAANAIATLLGILLGARYTTRWSERGAGVPLQYAGLAVCAVGLMLAAFAAAPWLAISIVTSLLAFFASGVFTAPFATVQSKVSPARVRTLSFSLNALFLVGGVIGFFYLTGLSGVSDDHGIRWGVFVLAPFFLIGAAVLASSGRFVGGDTEAALRSLKTTVDLRRQRLKAGKKSLLLCAGVDVAYESVQVLFGVGLEVHEGEIVALLGTNGAGKSTLLKAVSGLVYPSAGTIVFDSVDVTHADPQKTARLGIIQMPGGRSIFPTLTVEESLRLAGWMYKKQDPAHIAESTATALEYFPILRERSDQLAGDLSGGEQQMLGLAMAFIAKPRLLMIDELSLGLAPAIVGRLVEIVKQIHARGTTIILVEQSVNVALTLAKRAVFMEKGEIRFTGPTSRLLKRKDILRSVFLQGAASRNGNVARSRTPQRSRKKMKTSVRLELDQVSKHFGGITAVDGVSFSLRDGEILGVIGPNGAGKTTLFDLVSGFLSPDTGRVVLDGADVTDWSPHRRSRAGLGRSFQDARLFPSLTVAENIATACERHIEVRDPLASALGMPDIRDAEIEVSRRVDELVELLGLGAFVNKFVSELSTGSRRIVDLAMSIAHRPSVLILDEPSSGIAQRETEALGPLLLRIKDEIGCSLLVIEHDMPLVTAIADTMIALESGRLIATGTPKQVVKHPAVVESYLGTDQRVIKRSGSSRARAKRTGRARAGTKR